MARSKLSRLASSKKFGGMMLATSAAVALVFSHFATAQQGKVANGASPSVVVDSVNLTETAEKITTGLYIGAVVSTPEAARGIQKAADVWGLHVDLFVEKDVTKLDTLAADLARNGAAALIVEPRPGRELAVLTAAVREQQARRGQKVPVVQIASRSGASSAGLKSAFDEGFEALQSARNEILPQLPKFDETFPLIFPISPLPDHFFQASKFPYPEPLIRSVRTVSSRSASTHAHTSCHMGALLGNMIHRTSSTDPDVFLIGFEGGNLSVRPEPGAVSREKLSAIMTSYVLGVRGAQSERRDLLSENDGRETSVFKPTIHAPEELEAALKAWVSKGQITGYRFVGADEIVLTGMKGKDRRFRASFFLVSSDKKLNQASIELVVDRFGRYALETISTQQFRQVLSEVPLNGSEAKGGVLANVDRVPEADIAAITPSENTFIGKPLIDSPVKPRGGLLNAVGASVGTVVGQPLGRLLYEVDAKKSVTYKPYVFTLEGGFLVVTPEQPLSADLVKKTVERVDFDERGPLGADQTLTVSLADGAKVVFRRTVLQAGYLDQALKGIKDQGWISGWEYSGARGQGLEANLVVYNFLGKNRKFMSSLNTWPSTDFAGQPKLQWYVDGMQRLNFSLVTPEGWRQEFVEVPIAIPPVPRDVKLYSGLSKID